MTSWTELPIAVYDSETTGTSITTDRLVTAFLGRINGSDVTRRHWTADPGIPIPAEATAVHGIATEQAQKYGRPHADVVADVVTSLYETWNSGYIVCGYNLAFDMSLLATWAPEFEIRGPIFDGLVTDKQYDKYRKGSRKLSAVAIHYGVRLDDAHDAEGDAMAAGRLAWKMPRIYPHLANFTAEQLMQHQAAWHREQAESLREYLRRKGEPFEDVRFGWPVADAQEALTV